MTINTQAFLMGYGQKEAVVGKVVAKGALKGATALRDIIKSVVKRPGVGSLKDLSTTNRGRGLTTGIAMAAGIGTTGASYLTEDPYNPETMEPQSRHLYGTHILRGIGADVLATFPAMSAIRRRYNPSAFLTKKFPISEKRKLVKTLLTSGALIATPNVARAVIPTAQRTREQQWWDRAESISATTHRTRTMKPKDTSIESVNETLEGVKKGKADLKANLPYIVAGLSVLGVGAYAIHKYISARLDKDVKDEDDETKGENDMDPRLQAGLEIQVDKQASVSSGQVMSTMLRGIAHS